MIKKLTSSRLLKDLDLLNLVKNHNPDLLKLKIKDSRRIMQTIKKDIHFLSSKNIMDYSLLISIEDIHPKNIDEEIEVDHPTSVNQHTLFRNCSDGSISQSRFSNVG